MGGDGGDRCVVGRACPAERQPPSLLPSGSPACPHLGLGGVDTKGDAVGLGRVDKVGEEGAVRGLRAPVLRACWKEVGGAVVSAGGAVGRWGSGQSLVSLMVRYIPSMSSQHMPYDAGRGGGQERVVRGWRGPPSTMAPRPLTTSSYRGGCRARESCTVSVKCRSERDARRG